MSEWRDKALGRLEKECKDGKFDRYGGAMKTAVKDALCEFAKQDDEFAQAIAQGGSFADCMTAVGKKVKGNSISDLDAYSAAAEFYFPGSKVRFEMRIELCEQDDARSSTDALLIDLSAFL